MAHQDSTSPVLPRRSGRKVKPNRDPDYEYVQMRIDQLDRELAASGLSPHAPLTTSHGSPSSKQLSDLPVAVPPRSAIAAEIELAQLQRDKLALELEVLKLRAAPAENKVEGTESKPSTTRKKRTIDWPHEFCSGAPTLEFEKLEMADFVAGFLAMVKPYEAKRKEVMLQLLELLMLKASSYTWRSVRGFYAHIAKQVELCRLEFDDEETLIHLYWECSVTKSFWQSVKEFFVSTHLIPASHVLDMYECLGFGGEEDDVLLNHCLLLARYYIHCCKFKNVSPCIGEYVQRLKSNFEIEKQVSMVTGSENKFQQRWCKILQAL